MYYVLSLSQLIKSPNFSVQTSNYFFNSNITLNLLFITQNTNQRYLLLIIIISTLSLYGEF